MPTIHLSVVRCDKCHRHVGSKLLQCSYRERAACSYEMHQDSLSTAFVNLPSTERVRWIILLVTPMLLLFLGALAILGSLPEIILVGTIGGIFALSILIKSTILLNLRAGIMWQGYSLFDLPLRSILYRDVSILSFNELDLELPSNPFSVAGLRCNQQGTRIVTSKDQDAAALVEYALANLFYSGHLQVIRVRNRKQSRASQEITHLLKSGLLPEDGDPLWGILEARLHRVVGYSRRPVTIGWAVRQMYDGDKENPAQWLCDKVIDEAAEWDLLPQTPRFALPLRQSLAIIAEQQVRFRQDRQLANDAMVAMHRKYPDLLRLHDDIKRAILSRKNISDGD
jgi:hypothetical protein